MAIRFVDREPETGGEAPAKRARARGAEPVPEPMADVPEGAPEREGAPIREGASGGSAPDGEVPLPGLTHAKPEPKPRGRKKPMSQGGAQAAGRTGPAGGPPEAADALLPGLQLHAKPVPKPRGRKKAFG